MHQRLQNISRALVFAKKKKKKKKKKKERKETVVLYICIFCVPFFFFAYGYMIGILLNINYFRTDLFGLLMGS